MSNIVKPRTLSGFMELLPEQQLEFEAITGVLKRVYESYGFYPLDTPILEASEVLLAKGGGDTEKQIYRFSKGDTDLSMRFDLTVPLAKYVALNYGSLSFPFRRYQIGKVYRGERAQRGRYREFYQADIDIIGDGELSVINEAEIPAIIYNTFKELGLTRFKIRVNNRKLLSGFFLMLESALPASEMMRIIDKLDKIGIDKVCEELAETGISDGDISLVRGFISRQGSIEEILLGLEEYRGRNELFDCGLDELRVVTAYLGDFGVPEENFGIDLTIARGLDYYTGTVYETYMIDHPEIGSICSGGRYDDLAGFYTNKKLPGVGISIGLTRLFYILDEMNYINAAGAPPSTDVLVLPMTDDLGLAVSFARIMRERGLKAQIYYEGRKFKAKMAYADKIKAPFAAIIGEDEIEQGTVALKNMISGEQQSCTFEEAACILKESVKSRSEHRIIEVPCE
ncbi:MAG: histidine--tRNA ligase [Clostridiaceae bacterium]|nr:histidine--tRNA ligase [Clostridiaceae bacterium]